MTHPPIARPTGASTYPQNSVLIALRSGERYVVVSPVGTPVDQVEANAAAVKSALEHAGMAILPPGVRIEYLGVVAR